MNLIRPRLALLLLLPATLAACAQMDAASRTPQPAISPASRVLSAQELMDYPAWKAVRDVQWGLRYQGTDMVGSYLGQRFVAEYFCTHWCPGFTDAVYHFIDLKTPQACEAIGAEMRKIEVQIEFGRELREFCVASKRMLESARL